MCVCMYIHTHPTSVEWVGQQLKLRKYAGKSVSTRNFVLVKQVNGVPVWLLY